MSFTQRVTPSSEPITFYEDFDPPTTLAAGKPHHGPVSIKVHPRGGAVLIELWDPDLEDWYLPSGSDYTLDTDKIARLGRVGDPECRIRATNGAVYALNGVIYRA